MFKMLPSKILNKINDLERIETGIPELNMMCWVLKDDGYFGFYRGNGYFETENNLNIFCNNTQKYIPLSKLSEYNNESIKEVFESYNSYLRELYLYE